MENDNYIQNLLDSIEVIFANIEANDNVKKDLLQKLENAFLTDFYLRITKELEPADVAVFTKIIEDPGSSEEKFDKVNQLLRDKIEDKRIINIAVDELESKVKELILTARDTLKGNQREKFIEDINILFE